MLGRGAGRHLHALAHNRDPRRVRMRPRRRSIGSQRALGATAPARGSSRRRSLVALVDRVTRRMRPANRVGRTVVLRLRFDDFSRVDPLAHHARGHRADPDDPRRGAGAPGSRLPIIEVSGLTLVGISVTNLENDTDVQLALPFDRPGGAALDAALDEVRARFGRAAIARATLLGREQGVSMPMLPDD